MDDSQAGDSATASILLVDDIPANLRVLYESLNGREYRLFIANGGAQALDTAKGLAPTFQKFANQRERLLKKLPAQNDDLSANKPARSGARVP